MTLKSGHVWVVAKFKYRNLHFDEICITRSPGGEKKLRLKSRSNDHPAVRFPVVLHNILILTHSWVPQSADKHSGGKKFYSPGILHHSPAPFAIQASYIRSVSLFPSWCSFRCVTFCCASTEVCSNGSRWCLQEPDLFIFLFLRVCQAVVAHCQVEFVCRYFSRRFSCTY